MGPMAASGWVSMGCQRSYRNREWLARRVQPAAHERRPVLTQLSGDGGAHKVTLALGRSARPRLGVAEDLAGPLDDPQIQPTNSASLQLVKPALPVLPTPHPG